jgi:hypothetical protein
VLEWGGVRHGIKEYRFVVIAVVRIIVSGHGY